MSLCNIEQQLPPNDASMRQRATQGPTCHQEQPSVTMLRHYRRSSGICKFLVTIQTQNFNISYMWPLA